MVHVLDIEYFKMVVQVLSTESGFLAYSKMTHFPLELTSTINLCWPVAGSEIT